MTDSLNILSSRKQPVKNRTMDCNGSMYYFAYGSSLNRKQLQERCPDSKPDFIATLYHYKLVFVGWSRQWRGGVARIKPSRSERVLGAIYKISERDRW